MYTLTSPSTPEEAQINRNKMELSYQIQRCFNRIQYDRSITPRQRQHLQLEMHMLEQDYQEFFGKEESHA